MNELVPIVFYNLCSFFFFEDGTKKQFELKQRDSISSDPFVDFLIEDVFQTDEYKCQTSSPYSSPDLCFFRLIDNKIDNLFGLEVKTSKSISGDLNFNSTPPCGSIIIDLNGKEETIPAYYLFVQLLEIEKNKFEILSMMIVDGDFINSDFNLYLEAVNERIKETDLGSYGDGLNKNRPMYMFPNPLGLQGIHFERTTLLSKNYYKSEDFNNCLGLVATINKNGNNFFAYQAVRKLSTSSNKISSKKTKPRNKFKLTYED